MKETLLVFDFNNLLMKSLAVHPTLSFSGKITGGLFGFFSQFCSQINLHKPSDVVVCNDFPPYSRKLSCPEYKGDRKPLDPDMYKILQDNRNYCKDLLSVLDVNLYEEKGYEADDLIAIICDEYHSQYNKIVIVSNDSDLYQLFKYSNVYLQKGKVLFTKDTFKLTYPEITVREWLWVKAMSGTHNGVKGLKRIGDITAIKILKDKDRFDKVKDEHKDLLDLNFSLIKLPFEDTVDLQEISTSNFNVRKVINFLSGFGIKFQGNYRKALEILQGEF